MSGKASPVESSPAVKALRTLDQLWARVDELERNQAQDQDQIRTLEIAYRDLQLQIRGKGKPATEGADVAALIVDSTPSRFRSEFPPVLGTDGRRRARRGPR